MSEATKPRVRGVDPCATRLWLPRDNNLDIRTPSSSRALTRHDLDMLRTLTRHTRFQRYDPLSAIRDRKVFTALQHTADDYLESLREYGIAKTVHPRDRKQNDIVLKHRRVLVDDLHHRLRKINEAMVAGTETTMNHATEGSSSAHGPSALFFAHTYTVTMDAFFVKWCALRRLLTPHPGQDRTSALHLKDNQPGGWLGDEGFAHDVDLRSVITQTETALADMVQFKMAERDTNKRTISSSSELARHEEATVPKKRKTQHSTLERCNDELHRWKGRRSSGEVSPAVHDSGSVEIRDCEVISRRIDLRRSNRMR